jgi:hypothetical protein
VAGSTPYPWPYDGRIEAESLALVVVLPSVPVPGISADAGEVAMANALALCVAVTEFGGRVIRVLTPGPTNRSAVVGGDLWSPPTDLPIGLSITAGGLDGFFGSALDVELRRAGRTHLLLVGAPLETAVHSTMRTANDQGYECLLVEDACAALDPELKRNTLSMVEMSGGIFGAIGTTASTIAALQEVS